jgi:hypothetical protein
LEISTARKPSFFGVKYVSLLIFEGGAKVGSGAGVSVSTGAGAVDPIWTSVGINDVGVSVEVAKRSCVGSCVTVGAGVSVSVGGLGVGVYKFCRSGDNDEQPLRKITSRRVEMNFFMEKPFITIKD